MRNVIGLTAISAILVLDLAPLPARAADRSAAPPSQTPIPRHTPPPKPRDAPSCADWAKYSAAQAGSADKSTQSSQQAWFIGYLAGLAAATETEIPAKISNETLYTWVDHYCSENPQAMVSNGAGMLVLGLKEKGSL
jgi:hypothetical protein